MARALSSGAVLLVLLMVGAAVGADVPADDVVFYDARSHDDDSEFAGGADSEIAGGADSEIAVGADEINTNSGGADSGVPGLADLVDALPADTDALADDILGAERSAVKAASGGEEEDSGPATAVAAAPFPPDTLTAAPPVVGPVHAGAMWLCMTWNLGGVSGSRRKGVFTMPEDLRTDFMNAVSKAHTRTHVLFTPAKQINVWTIALQEVAKGTPAHIADMMVDVLNELLVNSGESPFQLLLTGPAGGTASDFFRVHNMDGQLLLHFARKSDVESGMVQLRNQHPSPQKIGTFEGGKGGVIGELSLYGLRAIVVGSHLSSGNGMALQRQQMTRALLTEVKRLVPNWDTATVVFMGDLNSRNEVARLKPGQDLMRPDGTVCPADQPGDPVGKANALCVLDAIRDQEYGWLIDNDQLSLEMREGHPLATEDFGETPINFPPTYKRGVGHKADAKTLAVTPAGLMHPLFYKVFASGGMLSFMKQSTGISHEVAVPAYTDRVLVRPNKSSGLNMPFYGEPTASPTSTDHAWVPALFYLSGPVEVADMPLPQEPKDSEFAMSDLPSKEDGLPSREADFPAISGPSPAAAAAAVVDPKHSVTEVERDAEAEARKIMSEAGL